jgi:hypothetical protein
MKYNLSFIQILNWIYVLKEKIKNTNIQSSEKQQLVEELLKQQKNLNKIIDVLNKKSKFVGVQKKFLDEYKKLKRNKDGTSAV